MYPTDDTIAALSTPPLPSAVAIVRISGPKSLEVLSLLFRARGGAKKPAPRIMTSGDIIDPSTKEVIDEVLAVFFRAPASYTGEDSVEIHCHGNPFIAKKILESATTVKGVRAAERGEFTYRAFLNGKMDLAQAEAVLAVIESKTEFALKTGLSQLKGRLAKEADKWRKNIVDILATVEAKLDYPEDDIDGDGGALLAARVLSIRKEMEKAVENTAEIFAGEVNVVITGKPNVGKSSLFNALAREDLAIVAPVAGTTTDTLSETLRWDGLLWKVHDTAGLSGLPASGAVEELGRARTGAKIQSAHAIIAVFDGSRKLDADDVITAKLAAEVAGGTSGRGETNRRALVAVINKSDILPNAAEPEDVLSIFPAELKPPVIKASAAKGEGIDAIKSALAELLTGGAGKGLPDAGEVIVANVRQKKALAEAVEALAEAARVCGRTSRNEELAAHQLRLAADAVSEILGEITPDDILTEIFSRFCVGK